MANTRLLLLIQTIVVFAQIFLQGLHATTFTIQNKCSYTVWPATLANSGSTQLSQTGFQLASGASLRLGTPAKWSGRIWGRTSCTTGAAGFSCVTGDCGSNQVSCDGKGGKPPATLAEFTINGGGKDTYDISLVDGFNLPVSITPIGRSCKSTACPANVNAACPPQLQLKGPDGTTVVGCRSACQVFRQDRYCCTGAFGSPQTCKPTQYSRIFKSKCPQAYSYAYDDPSSTFTCPTGVNYLIAFCP